MSDSKKVAKETLAKWEHLREKSVLALTASWSTGAISRAYEVPPRVVRQWRINAGIKAAPTGGKGRPCPNVGDVLA